MSIKKRLLQLNAFLHRWLGLLSGLVVFILGVTGCILTFQTELEDLVAPYRLVQDPVAYHRCPSSVVGPLLDSVGSVQLKTLKYPGPGRSITVGYADGAGQGHTAYLHPRDGSILRINRDAVGFFPVMLHLHIRLLLPGKLGHAIISYATVIYILLLLGGLILWWPKKWRRKILRDSLTIRWGGSAKRVNYDLHNVLGFYTFLPSIILAVTGIFISLSWFTKGVYWLSSGGTPLPERRLPQSEVMDVPEIPALAAVDSVWHLLGHAKHRTAHSLQFVFPERPTDVVTVTDNPYPRTAHLAVIRHFDRYTFKPIPMPHYWQKDYEQANLGDKIGRYNFDVHVGRIGGMPGKILAFAVSLVCASLPITGFLIWYKRNFAKRKKRRL
ncbi:Uncharacterized iron-regulated membrane protein [Parapedobacter luteus]|uniref:Uncharacterized iron-regulated membrane protein n=1 Tax=Parapedobacter luteus TaxID=623280 RepID=A0A1T5CUD4_9SPHI|nr:PepSY-associated TM helix domain-containing protein [Parapedobacter luteus]SKB63079.1 Uncharacterized iron-regulated membrane protein [Parapedobacter luteus]